MNLQSHHDLKLARKALSADEAKRIASERAA